MPKKISSTNSKYACGFRSVGVSTNTYNKLLAAKKSSGRLLYAIIDDAVNQYLSKNGAAND